MNTFRSLLFRFGQLLLKLRYKIEIKNPPLSQDKDLKKKGSILFLPNHPAEIDPIITMVLLTPQFAPRPLVVEHFFYLKGAKPFMRLVRALCLPNFETSANEWKRKKAEQAYGEIVEGLKNKDNFLIYPSGHLRRQPHEFVGGASFVHKIIQENPQANVVLIRCEGLWGSSFSRAITGTVPDFWKQLFKGVWTVLKNGIFFVPKRKVVVDFAVNPSEMPRTENRLEFNRFLENWYNQYQMYGPLEKQEEPLTLVSYSCFKKQLPEITYIAPQKIDHENLKVPEDVKDTINQKLSELVNFPKDSIDEKKLLSKDLGLDSLDVATMQAFLDQKYDVKEVAPGDIHTVGDFYALAVGQKEASHLLTHPKPKYQGWPKEKKRFQTKAPEGKNVGEAFLRICERMGSAYACADQISGPMSYKRLKMAAFIFAKKLKDTPGQYVGIMLPSAIGTYLTILACYLCKKTPVMLNWTTGRRALDYAQELLGIEQVVTSRNFLDRLDGMELGKVEEKLVFLEDVRNTIRISDKLYGVLQALLPTRTLMTLHGLSKVKPEDPAVVLFTSGTETLPKAVPLSHQNILENQRAAFESIDLHADDSLLGVLPPFHSFGFSVTGLFPLLIGVRVLFAPDPTDSQAMARDVDMWKLTLVCLAPSFMKNLFSVATPKQLKSVRLFVSGAEKAPEELFEFTKKLGNIPLCEGYGITECSPIVTINRMQEPRDGVGRALLGVSIKIIDPESGSEKALGETGEVIIHGPSVFSGYLGTTTKKDVFIELDGKRYYRSGDLGNLSAQGGLTIAGRIKRFVKIGGEMVSLQALEEELTKAALSSHWTEEQDNKILLAIGVQEKEDGRPYLTLFSTFSIALEEINRALQDAGFSRLTKINAVRELDEIPLTGTGKVHFRVLNELAQQKA